MNDKEQFQLGKLGKTFTGLSGKSKADFGEGKPYIPYLNIFKDGKINSRYWDYVKVGRNERQNKIIYGDIFFTTSSETIEEVGMSSVLLDAVDEAYLNSFCFGFRLHNFESLHPEYARYLFRSVLIRRRISNFGQGSTRYNLPKTELLNRLYFDLPSVPTQRKIARILSTIDGQIEKTEAIIAKYQAVKQGILQDLFTRGIDVRTGQLRPRYEDAPDLYQDSPLCMIPKEWAVIELDEGIKILDCKHVTPTYIPNGIPLLRPRNIKTEGLVLNDVVYVSEADYQFLMEKHKLKNEDILFTRNASFGVSCFLRDDVRYAIGQDVVILTDKTDEVTKFYIFQLLNSQIILKQIQRESGGSTFGRINLNDFRRFTIPRPTVAEQNKIRQTIESTDNILSNYRNALSKLQLLKQGIMQDLLSGKVEVTA